MLKKIVSGALAVLLMMSLFLTAGCSTPKVAITVNDKDITMGEYLAYLYEAWYSVYYGGTTPLYYYEMYGTDVWELDYNYGEGDDKEKLDLEDYLRQTAKDMAIRQVALEELMAKYDIKWDAEKEKEVDESLAKMKDSDVIEYGFNKASYVKAAKAISLNENALFYGLYDKDGERAVSEKDIREYYDDNYLSYKAIEVKLLNDKDEKLSDDQVKAKQELLEKYLKMYNESKDFDAVKAQYEKDTAEKKEEDKKDEDKKDEDKKEDDKKDEDKDDEKDEEEEEVNNRIDTTVDAIGDKAVSDAIKSVKIGQAEIKKFTTTSGTPVLALILRMDPDEREKDYDGDDNKETDYFEEQRNDILYSLKYEEFDKEVKEYVAKMDVKVNKTALRKAEPKKTFAAE